MLNIGGELAFILDELQYDSKKDLLGKLRNIKQKLKGYSKEERQILFPILAVSVQQAFYENEYELMRYKKFCNFRRSYEGRKD